MNLYAWTGHNNVFFTTSSTPAIGDTLKNSSGVSQDWEITSVSQDYSYITAIGDIAEWSFDRDTSQDILDQQYVSNLSNGTNTYTIKDANAIHSEDVTSTYSPTGTDPVNGTAIKAALDEDYAMVVVDYTAS